jgi:hypothetical protein
LAQRTHLANVPALLDTLNALRPVQGGQRMPQHELPPVRRASWIRYRVLFFFVAGLVAVDVGIGSERKLWNRYEPDEYRVKPSECVRHAHDAVLIGGSPVCEGFDPSMIAGVSWQGQPLTDVYNLGLSGATTTEIWHSVRHGIGVPPRLIVYGITASDLNDTRNEPHGPRSIMDVADLTEWVRLRPEAAQYGIHHFALGRAAHGWQLFRYRNAIRLWAANAVENAWPDSFPDAAQEAHSELDYSAALHHEDGFAPRAQFRSRNLPEMIAEKRIPDRFQFLEKYHVGGHLRYLHKILDWTETNKVAVILVDMPVSEPLAKMHADAFAVYESTLAQIERDRGVCVLRATRSAVGLQDTDFADLIHVNASGATKLSTWLRRQLDGE